MWKGNIWRKKRYFFVEEKKNEYGKNIFFCVPLYLLRSLEISLDPLSSLKISWNPIMTMLTILTMQALLAILAVCSDNLKQYQTVDDKIFDQLNNE